jgi:hypothetical protein
MPNKHLDMMLNIQTLGRQPGHQIMSIGAVMFDPLGIVPAHQNPKNQFYTVINLFDARVLGFEADRETLKWWKRQPIWSQLSSETMNSTVGVAKACDLFAAFMQAKRPNKVWANSPTFGVAMMEAMFDKVDRKLPVGYRDQADFRTILDLAHPDREQRPARPKGVAFPPHHALGDAIVQAQQLSETIANLPAALHRQIVDPDRLERRDVMLDLETLGRKPGYQILSVGAVAFDPLGQQVKPADEDRFYSVVNYFEGLTSGFLSDPETLKWWVNQPIWPKLGSEMNNSPTGVKDSCRMFSRFMDEVRPMKVWANSPSFDISMLEAAYRRVDMNFPIGYRQHADYRTVMDLAYPERESRPERPDDAPYHEHHALGDAVVQAEHLQETLHSLPSLLLRRLIDAGAKLSSELQEEIEGGVAPAPTASGFKP